MLGQRDDGAAMDPDPGPVPDQDRIGGMDVASCHAPGRGGAAAGSFVDVSRVGANDWCVVVGTLEPPRTGPERPDLLRATLRDAAASTFSPAAIIDRVERRHPWGSETSVSALFVARLELDLCGAWVTLANQGGASPIVVRLAGWIDIRGREAGPGPRASSGDDRVGLGPGDALVIASEAVAGHRDDSGHAYRDDALPGALLGLIGRDASGLAEGAVAAGLDFGAHPLAQGGLVLALRVPAIERGRGVERVVTATGIPADQLDLPGYPLGDLQPAREARIRLAPEPLSVPVLRRLLRRLLNSWRLASDSDVELVASEVATRVFAATASNVLVTVRHDSDVVRIEMAHSDQAGAHRIAGYDELSGPGLVLVEAISSDWGVIRSGRSRGVWFEMASTSQE